MRLLFEDVGVGKQRLTRERWEKYQKWVSQAQEARIREPFNSRLNQYDKAEELISWYTFAPLERMTSKEKVQIVSLLCQLAGIATATYLDDTSQIDIFFEKELPSPQTYLKWLKHEAKRHPIYYVRREAESKVSSEIIPRLEGDTHVDVLIHARNLLIAIEVKFTADISVTTKFGLVRNQLARMVDAGIEQAKDKGCSLVALLCAPYQLFHSRSRLYYYKINDYTDIVRLREDIPYRSLDEIKSTLIGLGWISLKDAVQTVYQGCKGNLDSEEISEIRQFYQERMIPFPL